MADFTLVPEDEMQDLSDIEPVPPPPSKSATPSTRDYNYNVNRQTSSTIEHRKAKETIGEKALHYNKNTITYSMLWLAFLILFTKSSGILTIKNFIQSRSGTSSSTSTSPSSPHSVVPDLPGQTTTTYINGQVA